MTFGSRFKFEKVRELIQVSYKIEWKLGFREEVMAEATAVTTDLCPSQ